MDESFSNAVKVFVTPVQRPDFANGKRTVNWDEAAHRHL